MIYTILLGLFIIVCIIEICMIISGEKGDGLCVIILASIVFGIIAFGFRWIDEADKKYKLEQELKNEELLPNYTKICDDKGGVLNFQIKTTILSKTVFLTCSNGTFLELPVY